MTQLNSRQFPKVYEDLGVEISGLGCIMLDVAPFGVTQFVEGGERDLFFGKTKDLKYAQGAVAEKSAHVTLLYGLMKPGPEWQGVVDQVLDGWTPPALKIAEVSFFPSNIPGEDYSCIIAKIEVSDELLEGNKRLQLLPHINTFPDYTPHLTLAYINNGPSGVKWCSTAREKWVQTLNEKFAGMTFPITQINYGGE